MTNQTRCEVPTCSDMKPFYRYLCPHHWRLVPLLQQRAVNSAYSSYNYHATLETVLRLREAQSAALTTITGFTNVK